MKIRNGFVSNSSSSSFLIYGTFIENGKLQEQLNISDEELEEKYEGSYWELAESLMEDVEDFEWHYPDGWDGLFVGVSWDGVRDDETGAEFKARVTKTLKEKFGDNIEVVTHEEAYYN